MNDFLFYMHLVLEVLFLVLLVTFITCRLGTSFFCVLIAVGLLTFVSGGALLFFRRKGK